MVECLKQATQGVAILTAQGLPFPERVRRAYAQVYQAKKAAARAKTHVGNVKETLAKAKQDFKLAKQQHAVKVTELVAAYKELCASTLGGQPSAPPCHPDLEPLVAKLQALGLTPGASSG